MVSPRMKAYNFRKVTESRKKRKGVGRRRKGFRKRGVISQDLEVEVVTSVFP